MARAQKNKIKIRGRGKSLNMSNMPIHPNWQNHIHHVSVLDGYMGIEYTAQYCIDFSGVGNYSVWDCFPSTPGYYTCSQPIQNPQQCDGCGSNWGGDACLY